MQKLNLIIPKVVANITEKKFEVTLVTESGYESIASAFIPIPKLGALLHCLSITGNTNLATKRGAKVSIVEDNGQQSLSLNIFPYFNFMGDITGLNTVGANLDFEQRVAQAESICDFPV